MLGDDSGHPVGDRLIRGLQRLPPHPDQRGEQSEPDPGAHRCEQPRGAPDGESFGGRTGPGLVAGLFYVRPGISVASVHGQRNTSCCSGDAPVVPHNRAVDHRKLFVRM